jgi:hypothetical protein
MKDVRTSRRRTGPGLSVLAYNLGNVWRRLVLPKRIENWSLTSFAAALGEGGRPAGEAARYCWLRLAEGHRPVRREMPASPQGLRTMPVSSPCSRTRWGTRAAIRLRRQHGWQERCCRIFCPRTRRARRRFPIVAGQGRTMPSIPFCASLQIGR